MLSSCLQGKVARVITKLRREGRKEGRKKEKVQRSYEPYIYSTI